MARDQGMWAEYYNEEERKEVEIMLKYWSKYYKRAFPSSNYLGEYFIDKPYPNRESRILTLILEIQTPFCREDE